MIGETLLGAVCESVFGYLLDKFDPVEEARARIAFKTCLSRAYVTFKRNHPRWAQDLFDEHFLKNAGAPFLAQCLTRDGAPDPAEFARAYATQFGFSEAQRTETTRRVCPAATNFLQTGSSPRLHQHAVFQSILDSQALERAQGVEATHTPSRPCNRSSSRPSSRRNDTIATSRHCRNGTSIPMRCTSESGWKISPAATG